MDNFKQIIETYKNETDYNKYTELYNNKIFPVIMEKFSEDVQRKIELKEIKKYEYLFLPVGFSAEPLILTINALRPKKVFFLYSQESEYILDEVVERAQLKPSQFEKTKIDSSNVVDIYEKLKKIYENKDNGLIGKEELTAFDVTGGKSAMASGMALCASFLNIDTVYVDSKYDSNKRKPHPGSETFIVLSNPYNTFYTFEQKEAIAKFNTYNYHAAKEKFEKIKNQIDDPRPFEIYAELAGSFLHLDNFNFKEGMEGLKKTLRLIERTRILMDIKKQIEDLLENLSCLKDLSTKSGNEILGEKEIFWALLANIWNNSERKFNQKRYDMSSLLAYRSLEMIIQRSLVENEIDPSKPNYHKTSINESELLKLYNQSGNAVYGSSFRKAKELPGKISLIQGMIMLNALKNPLFGNIELIKNIERIVDVRNKNILAHGFEIFDHEKVKSFRKQSESLLEKFYRVEYPETNSFKDYCKRFGFFKIPVHTD